MVVAEGYATINTISNACSECEIMEMIDFRNIVNMLLLSFYLSLFFPTLFKLIARKLQKSRNDWHIFCAFFKFQSIPIWGIHRWNRTFTIFSWTFQTYVVVCHNFIPIWFITIQTMFIACGKVYKKSLPKYLNYSKVKIKFIFLSHFIRFDQTVTEDERIIFVQPT